MSYVIPYEQYIPLLETENENTVKDTFQQLFELLVSGRRIPRSYNNFFKSKIEHHINSKSQKVRKWAYHCACFYYNDSIHSLILKQLMIEKNCENIIWALTALSIVYDNEEELKKCSGKRHEEFMEIISKNYLNDALYLFGGVIIINPNTILLTNNSADLAALSKIYAYKNLVKDKYSAITEPVIQEIKQSDDPYVREYAYWALTLNYANSKFQYSKDDPNDDVRKWQISLQIKTGDEDFIISSLKPVASCPQKVTLNIKEGIIRGLSEINYNSNFVPYVGSWFNGEEDEPILFKLIDYIIDNCFKNKNDGTYFDILKDSLNDSLLCDYIVKKIKNSSKYNLTISKIDEIPIINFEKMEGVNMQNINISGSGHNVAVATDNSSAIINQFSNDDDLLLELIQEVRKQTTNDFSKEEKEKILDALSFIESEAKSKTPKKTIIKTLLDGIKTIKGTVQFGAALANLINFFDKS